ncbi:hypothetical protein GCM10027614_48930 [Micromonospora vulcania]
MTITPTLPGLEPATVVEPRPGSRAARMLMPRSVDVVKDLAADYGVCTRPVSLRRTDLDSGQTEVIDMPCGATQEAKCPACATRARRLRQQQIREGWHRDDEPDPGPQPATDAQRGLIVARAHLEFARDEAARVSQWDQVADLDDAIAELESQITTEGMRGRPAPPHGGDDQEDGDGKRRVRSTKRRQDAPDLPRLPVENRTVGRTFDGRGGQVFRPSMFLTLTLGSYGRVHSDGTPVDPDSYDYRRAAWDAVHFPGCSIGSGRTCAARSAGTSNTPVPSSHNAGSPLTRTSPSGAPSPALSCGRSPPPRTTRCGGRPSISGSTNRAGRRSGAPTLAATPTRPPAGCCRRGMTPWTWSTPTLTPNLCTSPASVPRSTPKACSLGPRTPIGASATSPSTSPNRLPTATT